MHRRTFLLAVSSAAVAGTAGCLGRGDETPRATAATPSPSPTDTPPVSTGTSGRRTRRADVDEGDDVSALVGDLASGDELVFPSGRFTWRSTAHVTGDDWSVRCQDDTVFEIPAGMGDDERAEVLATRHDDRTADGFVLENLTFDADGRAAPALHLGVRNGARVDGLEYLMNGPLSDRMHDNGIRAFVENPDGVLRIDDYRQFNNGDLGGYGGSDSRIGIWVGPENRGTVHLRNPVLQGFPNNGCYVSRQPGTVVVEGGLLMNNNVSAVRVSGGVEVRGTTIYIDMDRYLDGPGVLRASKHNTRGLWGDNRHAGTDGGLVTGVSCIIENYRRCTGLATILENPRMTIRDSQFLLDTDLESVRAEAGEIELVDCEFAGSATGSTAGVGDITGGGNRVAPTIAPGDVPIESRDARFDWRRTHPETPGRPGGLDRTI